MSLDPVLLCTSRLRETVNLVPSMSAQSEQFPLTVPIINVTNIALHILQSHAFLFGAVQLSREKKESHAIFKQSLKHVKTKASYYFSLLCQYIFRLREPLHKFLILQLFCFMS